MTKYIKFITVLFLLSVFTLFATVPTHSQVVNDIKKNYISKKIVSLSVMKNGNKIKNEFTQHYILKLKEGKYTVVHQGMAIYKFNGKFYKFDYLKEYSSRIEGVIPPTSGQIIPMLKLFFINNYQKIISSSVKKKILNIYSITTGNTKNSKSFLSTDGLVFKVPGKLTIDFLYESRSGNKRYYIEKKYFPITIIVIPKGSKYKIVRIELSAYNPSYLTKADKKKRKPSSLSGLVLTLPNLSNTTPTHLWNTTTPDYIKMANKKSGSIPRSSAQLNKIIYNYFEKDISSVFKLNNRELSSIIKITKLEVPKDNGFQLISANEVSFKYIIECISYTKKKSRSTHKKRKSYISKYKSLFKKKKSNSSTKIYKKSYSVLINLKKINNSWVPSGCRVRYNKSLSNHLINKTHDESKLNKLPNLLTKKSLDQLMINAPGYLK